MCRYKVVSLECLDEDTVAQIREWRNQPFVRSKMLTRHIISEEEHMQYINSVKNNPKKGLFVAYLDGVPLGVFNYQPFGNDKITVGSYLVSEEYQELGYGAILTYMIYLVMYRLKIEGEVVIQVLADNEQAIQMNKRLGSRLLSDEKNVSMDEDRSVDVLNYKFELPSIRQMLRMQKIMCDSIGNEYSIQTKDGIQIYDLREYLDII